MLPGKVALSSNTSWYLYNFRRGTIEALRAAGHEVICFAPEDEFSPRLEALGARFMPVPMDAAGTHPLHELWLLWRIFRLLRRERPDYLFNFTVKMNLYFGLLARLLGIPYANNVSGLGTAFIHNSPLFRLVQRVYGMSNKGARRVFFQNPEDRELFLDKRLVSPEKTWLLPGSGVDVERFVQTSMPQRPPFTFLMIARLIADKGVREFVDAARKVRADYSDTRFVLVGPGGVPNRSAIGDAEIAAWEKEGIVELPGAQENTLPWLQACHVLVLPSYREGMPRTVLEAAAVGRPAIVSDVPGCRQAIVPDETGWFCEARSADSLARVMRDVLDKDVASFGKRAARRAREEFSEELVVQACLDCVEDVLAVSG